MPESGGDYLYIERAMGPLMGTIAGLGTWFSLMFKGALALIGGAPYLVLLFDLPIKPVALVVGAILIVVNVVGVKQTGRLQVVIVVVMLAALTYFTIGSAPAVDPEAFDGFLGSGLTGLLKATGFVFVSYAGVTKVASVAEEVEDPDRNIPYGMLGSLGFTTLLYVALVIAMVGLVPADDLAGSNIPMALAAEMALPSIGVFVVVLAALIALVSTANAGILSSSRYPLAMSRDDLAPDSFATVSDRFGTPIEAITITGAGLLLMVAFVPIEDIAKLASAFQILVFALINVAVIAFREADHPAYEPSFEVPLYPLTPIAGVLGGILLLPFMGVVPFAGAVVIVLGSVLWYLTFVRTQSEIRREGAATDAVRQHLGEQAIDHASSVVAEDRAYDVLVAVTDSTEPAHERTLLGVAAALAATQDGTVRATRFTEIPDQLPLDTWSKPQHRTERSFEQRVTELADTLEVPVEHGTVPTHDTRHAIVNHVDHHDLDAVVMERRPGQLHTGVFARDQDWIKRHTDADVIEVADRGHPSIDRVALVANCGHGDAGKLVIAEAVARANDADLEIVLGLAADAPETRRATIEAHQEELANRIDYPIETRIVTGRDPTRALIEATRTADLLVTCGEPAGLSGAIFGHEADRIVAETPATAVAVASNVREEGRFRQFLRRRIF
ncbi:MAG: amino acid permease, partial [Halodesulfurarchaeum sp.]